MTKRPGEVFDEDHPQISMKKVLTTKDATHGWKKLGRGGQGEVWLLTDTDPQMVMKKAFHTNDYASYFRELRTLKELSHENVVRYYDSPEDYPGIDVNEWLIFMEYCEHGSLKDVLINQEIEYSMATIAKWSMEMFSALEYIQSMKKVHHDVKPDNLFIRGQDYILKLGDFGIVRDLNTSSNLRGGTHGYMAPEVWDGRQLSGQEAYKCDIYGAGWVVLDIVNRSNPGNKEIDDILKDGLQHLKTIKRLVIGCTKKPVPERFGVDQGLQLCQAIAKEFEKLQSKPDHNNYRKRLEPPIGLYGEGDETLRQPEPLSAPRIPPSIWGSTSSAVHDQGAERFHPKVDWRDRLLMTLEEKLGFITAFDGHSFQNAQWDCKREDSFVPPKLNRGNCVHADWKKSRKQMCDEILEKLANLSLEDQYKCAVEMERLWKTKAPQIIVRSVVGSLIETSWQPDGISFRDAKNLKESIVNILDTFMWLIGRDTRQQDASQEFGVTVLLETDGGTLPHWDILQLLDKAIQHIEELGKLFTVRAAYPIVHIEGSRHSWFLMEKLRVFLRKDCTETRPYGLLRPGSKEINYQEINEKEPLNNEQLRRALIEARTSFKRKLRKQPHSNRMYAKVDDLVINILDYPLMKNSKLLDSRALLNELKSIPGGPFPGYVFLQNFPPKHDCHEEQCGIAGGYPETAEIEFQIPYHNCSTKHHIEYIEEYNLMTRGLQHIARREYCDVRLHGLLEELIIEIESRERHSVFYFAMVEQVAGSLALLFRYHPDSYSGTFFTNNMELVYSSRQGKFLRFVPMTLADIKPMLNAIQDHRNPDRKNEIDLKVVKPLINRFWKDIMRVGLGQTVGQPNSVVEVHADAMEHKPIGGALRKRFR